jgi:hypothetical protein
MRCACAVPDTAGLAFDYLARLTVLAVVRAASARAYTRHGRADGCARLTADVAAWAEGMTGSDGTP